MTHREVRKKFLDFFAARGHKIIPSASLLPEDTTTLFTSSGMQPLLLYFLGKPHPGGKRIANSQKSFRTEDIEEVGDNRHTTFFEMLGNWSFGDYWKEEQLSWFFEFLTQEIGLNPNRLYVTVFSGDSGIGRDNESIAVWKKLFESKNIKADYLEFETIYNAEQKGMGIDDRIFGYGSEKNWWSRSGKPDKMPAGEPGGPDSEVFYCFESIQHDLRFGQNCHPNCDCGRFMEIGNNVFMEYKKKDDGSFENLPQKNVDFGGGLERITAASNNDPNVFNIDSLSKIIQVIKPLELSEKAERIIADHFRASTFLICDGVEPSNKKQGYILRRLIRRMLTFIYLGNNISNLGEMEDEIKKRIVRDNVVSSYDLFLKMFIAVLEIYKDFYPEIVKKKDVIEKVIYEEIKIFIPRINNGLKKYNSLGQHISGKEAFDLLQNGGFPIELIRELAKKDNKTLDVREFEEEFKRHQELSRTASAGQFKGGLASHSEKIIRLHTATHLMNQALREVLGEHVWQKGSNITEEKTRFDFTHDRKMTDEEKKKVEDKVNQWIEQDLEVKKEIMTQEEASNLGAIGMFEEKYGELVSIYTVWDPKTKTVISREFCGGPHVSHTREIGKFKIIKEEAVSAGVRRIKAVVN